MAHRLRQSLRHQGVPLSDAKASALSAYLRHSRIPPAADHSEQLGSRSFGQRAADAVAREMGSWRFIILQSFILSAWLIVNSLAWVFHWDPYPFILLNLVLSFQAAFSAPVIMMSQNRQAARDRLEAEHDYEVDRIVQLEVESIQHRLDDLSTEKWRQLVALQAEQLELLRRLLQASPD